MNQPCAITVNPTESGPGKVMGKVVAPTGTTVDTDTIELANGNVNVCYTPKMRGDHVVEILFGGQVVPNGRFNQKVGFTVRATCNASTEPLGGLLPV